MDNYHIRQQLLSAALKHEPGLLSLNAATMLPFFRLAATKPETLAAELRGLAAHGYLVDQRPGREPLYLLTAKGRDQINQESDLHEYVWGEFASRFQQDQPPR